MYYHLKIFLRNLRRDKFYSAINIGGLAIGMAASALILMWVYYQWSFDRFHPKAKQIYQVWDLATYHGQATGSSSTSLVIGPALKDQYPEIVESVRISSSGSFYFGEGDRHISIRTLHADPSFFTVFSFPLLQGDVNTALNDPYSIILTEKAVRRLFGNEDPMGKTLMCDGKYLMTVTGIMKDLPTNTRFDFEILGSLQFVEKVWNFSTTSWYVNLVNTYVELTPYAQIDQLNASIGDIIQRHTDNRTQREAFLHPLNKSYLYDRYDNGVFTGSIIFVRIFSIFAGVILLIACINFVNLSIARSSLRAKEVGVRKVMGSRRIGLVRLFLSESIILACISGVIALIIVHAALPYFSGWLTGLSGKIMSVDIFDMRFWLLALAFILFTGLLAGCYLAFFLSAFRPVKVLKGVVPFSGTRITLRKILVVLQFFVAVFLMISVSVARRQIVYAQNRSAGYDMEHLIHITLTDEIKQHYPAFRYDLMSSGSVTELTKACEPMTMLGARYDGVKWKGKDPDDQQFFNYFFADGNWAEMMGVELVEGRYPDPAIWSTDSSAFLLSELAVKTIGFENPIGETISFWGQEGRVIGVIKDLVLRSSPFEDVYPLVVGCSEKIEGISERTTLLIRLSPGKTADKLASIENIYRKYCPNHPFDYKFTDDEYRGSAAFKMVQAIESLTVFFTIIAILISCMGLFALSALTAERRRKEIGIRKVFGASVADITLLVSKEYIMLTLIAFSIAAPLAWFVMVQVLNMIPYRTNIPVWLIVAVGAIILLITLLTVGFQAFKAATRNPAKSIKLE